MNLNDLARIITVYEGKEERLTIAQVKEVINILGNIIKRMSDEELQELIQRLKTVKDKTFGGDSL